MTADEQLTTITLIHLLTTLVENVDVLLVDDRQADWAVRSILVKLSKHLFDVPASNLVCLAGAVDIQKSCLWQSLDSSPCKIGGNDLAVKPYGFQVGKARLQRLVTGKYSGEQGWCEKRLCDLLAAEKINKHTGVIAGFIRYGNNCCSAQKGSNYLPHEEYVAGNSVARLNI